MKGYIALDTLDYNFWRLKFSWKIILEHLTGTTCGSYREQSSNAFRQSYQLSLVICRLQGNVWNCICQKILCDLELTGIFLNSKIMTTFFEIAIWQYLTVTHILDSQIRICVGSCHQWKHDWTRTCVLDVSLFSSFLEWFCSCLDWSRLAYTWMWTGQRVPVSTRRSCRYILPQGL